MKSKFTWIFTLLLAFFIQFSFAQERTITGVVTDATGLPIPGATVMVEGSAPGVQTDFDGKYAITASTGQKLVFSFVGMKSQTVTVGASSTVSVQMQDDVTVLNDVVVEGYRTTARRTSNVAVTTVTAETIEGRPNVNFVQSLQGQIPGLNISTGSGQPGSNNTTVILRGRGSLSGNIEPLYVIDGVPANVDLFRSINSNDLESVSVLKDAGATSIYGNRGANGVIIVKTKKGRFDSKLNVRYSSVTGFTTMQEHDYRKMNSQQLLTIEKAKGVGLGASLTDQEINNFPVNVDWEDYFFRTGISQDHNISFTQGSKNLNSFISIGYFEQDGIVPSTDIKRITIRSNFGGKSDNDKFNYNLNTYAGFSRRNQLEVETRTDIDGNVLQNPLQGSLGSLPYMNPGAYINGQQLLDEFGTPNFIIAPYMLLDYIGNITNEYDELKLLFNGAASYRITDNITFGANAGIDYTQNTRTFSRLPESYLALTSAFSLSQQAGIPVSPGLLLQSFTRDIAINANTRLSYNKIFNDKHTVDVSLLTEYYKGHQNGFLGQTLGLDARTFFPGAGTGYVPFNPNTPTLYNRTVTGSRFDAGLFSYFGQLDYDYDSKYGISVTGRRDASYRFTADNKWGTFWSVAARWNIDQESFLENSRIFTELKLRGSIGTAGNQNIVGNSPYTGANLTRTLYDTSTGYGNVAGLDLVQIGNEDLRWETIKQINLGLDFVIAKRLRGSLDVYRKETIDLYQETPVSLINGISTQEFNNGNMVNDGVEALLAYDVIKSNDFLLTVSGNGSYNKNYLKNIPIAGGEVAIGDIQLNANDYPAFMYYTVRYVGVNPATGNTLYLTADGNLTENPTTADRVRTDKSLLPKYQGGFGFEANYKGFYLTTQFTFVADVWRYDFDLANLLGPNDIGSFNKSEDLLRAWTPDNRVTDVPSLNQTNTAADDLSDRFLYDASYVRLKFASLGYNVPQKFLDQTFLSGVRVYAQAENVLTWTKWRGFDAESNAASTFGGYPTPRIISFGLDLNF